MKIFGFTISKAERAALSAYGINSPGELNELVELVKSYEWVRNILVSEHGCAMPSVDPFQLSALFDSNGYHSNAIYWKQVATVGQGYECSDALHAAIDEANENESFQEILNKFSLDLETYGSAYIEPVLIPGAAYFYNSPALLTRVKPPVDNNNSAEESFVQFVYKKGYGVASREFDKFKRGLRTGIRQLKLPSPNADPWYGKPEYLSAQKVLTLNFSILTLADKWFSNSMMLDKLFVLEGGSKLTSEQKREMTGFMKRNLKGLENAAKSLVLELQRGAKLNVQDMNGSIKEAPYIELRKENRDEIASAHRVPPRLLAIMIAGQIGAGSEVEGQLKIFKIGFVDARQRMIERFFQKLFADMGLPDAKSFKLTPMDITAGSIDAQVLSLLTGGAPILTPAEAREDWFTEKGVFTAKGATLLTQYLALLSKAMDKL